MFNPFSVIFRGLAGEPLTQNERGFYRACKTQLIGLAAILLAAVVQYFQLFGTSGPIDTNSLIHYLLLSVLIAIFSGIGKMATANGDAPLAAAAQGAAGILQDQLNHMQPKQPVTQDPAANMTLTTPAVPALGTAETPAEPTA
jgi:hypothetical protein